MLIYTHTIYTFTGMWTENLNLFLIAVEKGRVDFLEMFKDMLDQTVAYIGHYEKRTLLSLVLEKRDVKSLGIVLSAWTHTLNKPSADYLGQGRYHPSFLFPKKVCNYTLYVPIALYVCQHMYQRVRISRLNSSLFQHHSCIPCVPYNLALYTTGSTQAKQRVPRRVYTIYMQLTDAKRINYKR